MENLDIKDFGLMQEISDNDRFLMTKAANAHFAAAIPFSTFKEKVLQPLIESSRPAGMGCEIFTSIDQYEALTELDPKTLYVIIENGKITQAFLGEYPFAVGGSGGDDSGIPVEQVMLDLNTLLLELGGSKQLNATYQPTNATSPVMSWTTSNHLVATVSNGLVTSVGKGECIIKVKARSGAYAECMVTVEITLVGLSFSSSNNRLVSGFTTQLVPVSVPADATLALTYSSLDANKATVNQQGVVTPVGTTGTVTIKAVNKNGVQASVVMEIVPFSVSVACSGIDTTDNSVSTIFTKWLLAKKGTVTHYKYAETITESGTTSTLQSVDWTPFPANGEVDIELYAEFGNKFVNWEFKNGTDSYVDQIAAPVLYKEPQLVTYNFDVDVQCTPEQAQAMSMEIPYYKYDKKFVYNLRNDDNLTSLWRMAFRFCNRELMPKVIKRYERTEVEMDALLPADRRRAPRRLGYTNGCGVLLPFVFDVAGTVQDESGKTFDTGSDITVQRADILRHKDYGGHFLVHNMKLFASDTVQPKYANDYSYALQRDRQVLEDEFGYTSVTFANPDGDPYYTQPCIKDPKTLLMSGGGYALRRPEELADDVDGSTYGSRFPDEVKYYGLPAHRAAFSWDSNLADVPLSEIRNTLNTRYVYSENHPFRSNLWKTQYQKALVGQPTLATELTHGLGYDLESGGSPNPEATALLKTDLDFFEEIFDVVGANGADMIWFCPADESIEYMYYQRVAKITKTVTATGCRFTISITIPGYLSYKTYSAIIRNLPETAVVTRGQGVTSFHKNMKTGLINFGYSTDATERAARYVQKYLANPTVDNLDKAWYFVRQLGELQAPYAAQLPAFSEMPVLASASCPASVTTSQTTVTTTNSNKEFGEANFLDVSETADFGTCKTYVIPTGGHKWYDSLDASCLKNEFVVDVKPLFGVVQTLHARLRNVYGVSETKTVSTTLTRQQGVNDPALVVQANPVYFESAVELAIVHANVTEFRYKLGSGSFTSWIPVAGTLAVTLAVGDNTLVVEARNNLGETVSSTVTIKLVSAEWEVKATAAFMDTFVRGETWASPSNNPALYAFIDANGFTKLPQSNYDGYNTPLYDTNKVNRGIVRNSLEFTDNTYGFIKWNGQGNANWFAGSAVTGDDSAVYPDSMISKITTAGNAQTDNAIKPGFSGRSSFWFTNLAPGRYIVNLFGRHLIADQTGTGIAFVRDDTDAVLTSYIVSKQFNGRLLYDNRSNVISLEFEVTSATQKFQIGMDARFDLFGNDAANRQYGFNVLHLVKIRE